MHGDVEAGTSRVAYATPPTTTTTTTTMVK
jgi:hypothetical protein